MITFYGKQFQLYLKFKINNFNIYHKRMYESFKYLNSLNATKEINKSFVDKQELVCMSREKQNTQL